MWTSKGHFGEGGVVQIKPWACSLGSGPDLLLVVCLLGSHSAFLPQFPRLKNIGLNLVPTSARHAAACL